MPHPDSAPAMSASRPPVSSRRAFLRGILGVVGAGAISGGAMTTLAGCDPFDGSDGGDAVERQTHELDMFLMATVALGNRYDTTMGAIAALRSMLTPLRDAHRAHAEALADALGTAVPLAPTSTEAVPTSRGPALAALVTAEKAARTAAVASCLSASGRIAALLGSIAAARASHLEVLR